ncbi:MAG: hypothetical protein O2820_05045 [Planctomycetota bacterium]|nr:hypothetical protein [Planctomycetota bacterium]MDA1248570.1 hypothetical protein [Planctomycetota bacterium]
MSTATSTMRLRFQTTTSIIMNHQRTTMRAPAVGWSLLRLICIFRSPVLTFRFRCPATMARAGR